MLLFLALPQRRWAQRKWGRWAQKVGANQPNHESQVPRRKMGPSLEDLRAEGTVPAAAEPRLSTGVACCRSARVERRPGGRPSTVSSPHLGWRDTATRHPHTCHRGAATLRRLLCRGFPAAMRSAHLEALSMATGASLDQPR